MVNLPEDWEYEQNCGMNVPVSLYERSHKKLKVMTLEINSNGKYTFECPQGDIYFLEWKKGAVMTCNIYSGMFTCDPAQIHLCLAVCGWRVSNGTACG